MNDEPAKNTGAEELVMAVIGIEHLESAATQAEVVATAGKLPGVKSLNIVEGKLHVSYDPLRITEQEIEEAIRRIGARPLDRDVERDSPFAEN